MNKEEIETFTRYEDPIIKQLQQENKQLKEELEKEKQKNSKALNYINERKEYKSEPFYLDEIQTEIVEDILKGKFNE